MFIYFSQVIDRPVVDYGGELCGYVYDIIVEPTAVYPQSALLIVRKGWPNRRYAVVKWQDVSEIDRKETRLKVDVCTLSFKAIQNNKEELAIRRDILDQQVVDTYNHKVIRVNDVHLLFVENFLMMAHVDISTRGLLRRLGFERTADLLVKAFNSDSAYLKQENLISWKHIQPLSINPVSMSIKVNVPQRQLGQIPAADLGEIFLDLNVNHQIALFKSLDLSNRTKIFTNIDLKTQKLLMEELPEKEAVEILNAMPSDEATDFLEKLPKNTVVRLLALMENMHSKRLSQLLGYSSDSAGGLMTTDFIAFTKDTPVAVVLKQIREKPFKTEPAQYVYIVDEANRLIGSTNFRRLILSDPADPVGSTAFPKMYFVHLDSGVKEVAYLMEKYKYYAMPVVDTDNVIQGIITVDDILSQVISIAWRRLKRIKAKPTQ